MAKKNNPQMRFAYCKERDEYQLLTRLNEKDEWGYEAGWKCVRAEGQRKDDEPMFVCCTAIEEMKKLVRYGYEMIY